MATADKPRRLCGPTAERSAADRTEEESIVLGVARDYWIVMGPVDLIGAQLCLLPAVISAFDGSK